MLNGELNENGLDNVLGGVSNYSESLKKQIQLLNHELVSQNKSVQEKAQIYMRIEKLQSELDELDNQKSNGRIR